MSAISSQDGGGDGECLLSWLEFGTDTNTDTLRSGEQIVLNTQRYRQSQWTTREGWARLTFTPGRDSILDIHCTRIEYFWITLGSTSLEILYNEELRHNMGVSS